MRENMIILIYLDDQLLICITWIFTVLDKIYNLDRQNGPKIGPKTLEFSAA